MAAGTVGAVLGLGGGILLVPILTLFFGVDLHYAMGASIISVIATSSGAAASYLRTGLSNVRIGLFLVVATISGALVGASLSGVAPVRWLELILGLALAYSAFTTIKQIDADVPDEVPADRIAMRFGLEGTYYDRLLDQEVKYRAVHVARGFAAMFAAGILSGLLGMQRVPRPERHAHPREVFVSIGEVLRGLAARPIDPAAMIAFGLVLLLMTPVLGVVAAIPAFLAAGDRRYAAIGTVILTMLALGALLTGGVG